MNRLESEMQRAGVLGRALMHGRHPARLVRVISLAVFGCALAAGPLAAVPPEAEEAFAKKYPDAEVKEWTVDRNGNWEASFTLAGDDRYRADFSPKGAWVQTEQSIKFEELPDEVQRAVTVEYGGREIVEVEVVEEPGRGRLYEIEFGPSGGKVDVQYRENGERADPVLDVIEGLHQPIEELAGTNELPEEMSKLELLFELGFNILTIFIFAYLIYYRRHHDHGMLYLLLGFNLFLFPIFLLGSSLTVGFGFMIFALLALVRLRSETFSKAEVAYLLGAVALTFINARLPARVEVLSSGIVLLTAWLGDHSRLWRDAYQKARIRYILKDTEKMLDRDYLRTQIAKDFKIEVNEIEIEQVDKNQVRLTVMYRDPQDVRKARREEAKKGNRWRSIRKALGG